MFKIKAPNKMYTRQIAGVHFINGEAETENESIARWLEGRGFTVEVEDKKLEGKPEDKQKSIAKMNVEELEKYAGELGVDLTSCSNKEEKKAAILAFLNNKE